MDQEVVPQSCSLVVSKTGSLKCQTLRPVLFSFVIVVVMPLFSGNRGDNGSIEYTAVGNDVPRSEDDQRELQPTSNTVEAVRASLDTSGIKANSTTRSKAVDYQVLETGSAPSEKTPGSNNGPTITGWPQGPRKLRGFSAPFLVGDALLILLPVAFLGMFVSSSGWREPIH
jgi:hypothetical protein